MINIQSIGPKDLISLDPREDGFAYGMAIFESIKVAEGRVYFWARHWRRFQKSISECLGYHCTGADEKAVLSELAPLVKDYGIADFILKLSFMMRAEGPSIFIYGRAPFPSSSQATLFIDLEHRIDEEAILKGQKTHNYFENRWLRRAAQAAGFTDYLRFNRAGHACETTSANCFFIREGKVVTPPKRSGIIPGIIRECLIETMGFETSELTIEELARVEAAFISNSAVEILPIERIEGFPNGSGLQFEPVIHPLIDEARTQLKIIAKAESINLTSQ